MASTFPHHTKKSKGLFTVCLVKRSLPESVSAEDLLLPPEVFSPQVVLDLLPDLPL